MWNELPDSVQRLAHVSVANSVPKAGNPLGRTCWNLSSRTGQSPSLNDSTDHYASERAYPRQPLPDLAALANLVCAKQRECPGELLLGATCDVNAAYRQCTLSVDAALHRGIMINCDLGRGILERVWIVNLTVMFGDCRGGDVYTVFGKAIDYLHNRDLEVRASHTYIDDTLAVDDLARCTQS